MKKILTVLLVICVTLSMTACGEKKTNETNDKTEVTMNETAVETTAETIVESDAETKQTDADAASAVIATLSIPLKDQASGIMHPVDNEGLMTILTTENFEDAVAFYKEAIEELEAQGEEIDNDAASELLGDSAPSFDAEYNESWAWTGTYEDGKTLTISIVGGKNRFTQNIVVDVEL